MAARRRPNPQQIVRVGGWKGVRDTGHAPQQNPEFLQDAINCLFDGGVPYARQGFNKLTPSTALGTGTGFVSLIHVINRQPADSVLAFAVVDSKVYRYNSGTTWADVTPASGPTIGTSTIYAIDGFSTDELIFAGVPSGVLTKPWRATGLEDANLTGTNIEINTAAQAWVARNSPTVYGGKVFFPVHSINSVIQNSLIVWSEEADVTTGYLQTGFTNSWDLFQTSVLPLTAILGTDAGLYYFRENSIGLITGAVNATFATSSTRDSVTEKVGHAHTTHPPLLANGYIWFIDSELRPWRFRVGSQDMEPLWEQMRGRFQKVEQTTSNELAGSAVYIKDLNKVVMRLLFEADDAAQFTRNLYVFDADSGNYEGRWLIQLTSQPTDETPSVVQVVQIHAGQGASTDARSHTLWVGGNLPGTSIGSPAANSRGHIYVLTTKKDYSFGDVGGAMHQSITTMLVPDEQNVELKVDEVALEVVPDATAVSLDYYTPYGSSTGLSATGTASADSIQSSYDHGIVRWGLGQNAVGRWFRARFHKNVAAGSTQHAFEQASYKVRTSKAGPLSP